MRFFRLVLLAPRSSSSPLFASISFGLLSGFLWLRDHLATPGSEIDGGESLVLLDVLAVQCRHQTHLGLAFHVLGQDARELVVAEGHVRVFLGQG